VDMDFGIEAGAPGPDQSRPVRQARIVLRTNEIWCACEL